MDLEPLPPEEPKPTQEAPAAAPWYPAPWQAPSGPPGSGWASSGTPPPPPAEPRFGKSTKIVAGGLMLALVAGGAWAAGTALHSSPSTVRFQPASTAAANNGGVGQAAGGQAPTSPAGWHLRRGVAGTVAKVNPADFTVTLPARRAKSSTGSTPTTPPAPVTVKVTGTTTYTETKSATLGDIATGMRLVAFGTRNADGSLAASRIALVQAGLGPTPKNPAPPAGTTPPATKPPIVFGTVSSVTHDSPAKGDVTVVVSTPNGNQTVTATSATGLTETLKATLGDVKTGDRVVAVGSRATDGTVTATAVQIVAANVVGGPGPLGFGPGRFGFGPGRAGFGPGRFGFGPGRFGPAGPKHSGVRPGSGTGTPANASTGVL